MKTTKAATEIDDYVTDILMRDLVGHDRKPASFLVYLWLTAEQQRRASAIRNSPSPSESPKVQRNPPWPGSSNASYFA
jgi:hypothetical protein